MVDKVANVRCGGWPFALKVMVPGERDKLFPESFGLRNERRIKKNLFNDLCYFVNHTTFCEQDDDTLMQWDLFGDELDGDVEVQDAASTKATEVMYWISLAIQLIEDGVYVAEMELQAAFALIGIAEHASLRGFLTAFNMFYWRSVHPDIIGQCGAKPPAKPPSVRLDVGGLPWCGQRGRSALLQEMGGSPIIHRGRWRPRTASKRCRRSVTSRTRLRRRFHSSCRQFGGHRTLKTLRSRRRKCLATPIHGVVSCLCSQPSRVTCTVSACSRACVQTMLHV